MSAIHERMLDRYIKHPGSTSLDYWGDGASLDSHAAMVLASNAAHLSLESRRHLVLDPLPTHYEGKNTWEDLVDAVGPSETDLAAATDTYSHVSWAPKFARRYGPFIAVCDRETLTGVYAMRRVRGRVQWAGNGGGAGPTVTALHCALTTHSNPQALVQGDFEAYERFTEPVAAPFSATVDIDWSPSTADSQSESRVCRAGGSGSVGPTRIGLTFYWIWLCVLAETGANLLSVSFWEDV